MNCMTYVNMNMVRAGVVKHPIEWRESGYFEMMLPKKRYNIIDYNVLLKELCLESLEELQKSLRESIIELMGTRELERQPKWTESLAVGSEDFVERIKGQLDIKAKSRTIVKSDHDYILSESEIPYKAIFDPKNDALRPKNGYI